MDLFGTKEHHARHDEVERQLRGHIEQVVPLTSRGTVLDDIDMDRGRQPRDGQGDAWGS